MKQNVLERLALEANLQFVHAGPVALQHFAGMVNLIQAQSRVAIQHSPVADAALQRAQLPFLIFDAIPLAQPLKQAFGFKLWRFFQFLFHFRPVLFKWVATRAVAARFFQITGQFS